MTEVWVGWVEVRQLPGSDHQITLSGKGAYTWITCWAQDATGYEERVKKVMGEYGLFVIGIENAMPFAEFEKTRTVSDELFDQLERTSTDENFTIFGTLHNYMTDN